MATLKDRFINSLLGVPVQTQSVSPSVSYGENIDNYLNTLGEQSYMKPLLNQPKETGLTLDQYKEGVANGLNYGIPEIVKAQQKLGIKIPKTDEEKELARVGQFNQPTQLSLGTSNDLRKGGLIPDLISGFRENYTQGFDVNNLAPQNKGLAARIGEGLGTLARFYDKPIGRFAAAAGLSALTGNVNPMNEGITAYVGRQGNLTRDKAYRQNLVQMGLTEDKINAIPGIMSDDVYKNLVAALNAQEMRKYREAYLTNQQEQNKIMNQFRQDQLKYQRMQDAYDRAQKNREFNYRASQDAINNNLKLKELALKGQKNTSGNINNLNAVNAQLQRFEDSFANMPSKIESNTLGRLRAATGFQTKQEANFNSQRQLLFNKIARDLGGEKGVLSDQDIKRIEGALPSYTDSLEQKNAKMSAIYDLLNDRLAVEGGSLQQPQQKNKAIQVGKYKVRVK